MKWGSALFRPVGAAFIYSVLFCPILSNACLQSIALLYFLNIYSDDGHEFFAITFTFFYTSLQMNANTTALSVAQSNCCVLTSSYNIPSKNGSLAWMKAQKNASLHWCSVTVLCKFFIRHDDPIFSCMTLKIDSTLQLIHFSHFNGYSLNGYKSFQKTHSSAGQNHER